MEFYVFRNNTKQGPFTVDELSSQDIDTEIMVWSVGYSYSVKKHLNLIATPI